MSRFRLKKPSKGNPVRVSESDHSDAALILRRIGDKVEVTVNPRAFVNPVVWGQVLVNLADAVAREAEAQGLRTTPHTHASEYAAVLVAIHVAMAKTLEERYPEPVFVSDAVVKGVARTTAEVDEI